MIFNEKLFINMVNFCVLCKVSSGQMKDVSFHSFPSDENRRKEWIEIIKRDAVSKTSRVCSRHFRNTDFKCIDGKFSKKLTATAVPSQLLSENDNRFMDFETHESADVDGKNGNNLFENETPVHASVLNDHNLLSTLNCKQQTNEIFVNVKNREHMTQSNLPNIIRSNSTETNIPRKRARLQYLGDLRREDFTSEEAFKVVQRHGENCRKKFKSKDKSLSKLNKKVSNIQDLLDHLKSYGLITEDGYDALTLNSSPALKAIVENILSKKKRYTYTSDLKEFSCSLLFYSSSTYRYVRENFLKSLPSPQTVRRWFSKVDLGPGISQPILRSVRSMIEKAYEEKKYLQWSLQVDEMSIKKQIDLKNNEWYGCVDIGGHGQKEKSEQATYVLVIMLVLLNGHFKTPIAYYFLKSLSGEARGNLITEILLTLHENGISDIRSITFDGAATNLSMVSALGADIHTLDKPSFFEHPATDEPVYVIPDACHMLKLIRNALATRTLIDSENNAVDWNFLKKLVDVQEKEGVHLGTKIRRRHVEFEREKMKVKLAAQIFSTRVSDALRFMVTKDPNFKDAIATAKFCKNINDMFDFLNSKSKFGHTQCQNALSPDNLNIMSSKIIELIDYVKQLQVQENGSIKSILESKRKTGFWGLIVALRGVIALATYLFDNQIMSYLITYKLSQDHLETFFSCVRRMGGFNNNPTCYQFQQAYKKLVSHVNSIIVPSGNCIQQDDTKLLKIESKSNQGVLTLSSISFDHDYAGSNNWCWSEYSENVVTYVAGFIVKSLKKKITCQMCLDSLETDKIKCDLIEIKNRPSVTPEGNRAGGLLFPSLDVVNVCKVCEKVVRMTTNLFCCRNIVDLLLLQSRKILLPMNLFKNLDICMQNDISNNHKFILIDKIAKKYFSIRLNHEARSIQDKTARIRTFHNKIVLFKNQ